MRCLRTGVHGCVERGRASELRPSLLFVRTALALLAATSCGTTAAVATGGRLAVERLQQQTRARAKDWSCEDPHRQWERSKDDRADRAEVIQFAKAMAVENWTDGNRLWLNESRSVCEWEGVCCEVGPDGWSRVTELHVERNGLNGSFPATFNALSRLKVLNVHLNNVTNFPPGVEALVHLEQAKFGRNPICGTVPEGFAKLVNLTKFNCNFCCRFARVPLPFSLTPSMCVFSWPADAFISSV